MKIRHLLLGRKGMTNLDSVLKSRDITLSIKVCIVKAMVFPYGSYVKMKEVNHKEGLELKNCLMKVKEESEKAGLKLSIQKTKIMASVPITSWQIEGEKVETVKDFIFLGSKITVDSDCSHVN